MSGADQMLLELDNLLPEKEEGDKLIVRKSTKQKTPKSEAASVIEVPQSEVMITRVEELPPTLSAQTIAEMEAGRKALQNYR
jgi:hypothetical protein